MENAVKALSMAGSVLLSLLIIGLLVFGYDSLRLNEEIKNRKKEEQEVSVANTQFDTYISKKYLIGSEVLSIANLADNYNSSDYLNDGYKPIKLIVEIPEHQGDFYRYSELYNEGEAGKFQGGYDDDGSYRTDLFEAYQKDQKAVIDAQIEQYLDDSSDFKYGGHSFDFWLQWINPSLDLAEDGIDYKNNKDYTNFAIRYFAIALPEDEVVTVENFDEYLDNYDGVLTDLWKYAVNYYNKKMVIADFSRINFIVKSVQYDSGTGRITEIKITEVT